MEIEGLDLPPGWIINPVSGFPMSPAEQRQQERLSGRSSASGKDTRAEIIAQAEAAWKEEHGDEA